MEERNIQRGGCGQKALCRCPNMGSRRYQKGFRKESCVEHGVTAKSHADESTVIMVKFIDLVLIISYGKVDRSG